MATLNTAKLAESSINVNGEKLAVKKILKTKGEVILVNGDRIPLEGVRAVGRGFVYDAPKAAGGKKPAASAAPAAANNAPTVTFDELEGKNVMVDGERLAVDGFVRSKGIVKMDNGARLEIANITRKGRGYVYNGESAAPATPKAETKPRPSVKPKAEVEADVIEPKELRGERVKVAGRFETVEKVSTAKNQVKTDKGTVLDVAFVVRKGSKFFYQPEAEVETTPAPKAETKPKAEAKPSGRTGGIRRRDEEEVAPTPKAEAKPKVKVKAKQKETVEAFTVEIGEEMKILAEEAAKKAITDDYDVQFVTSGAILNDQVLTVELTFAVAGMSPKKVAKLLEELEAAESEEDEEAEDFDDSELEGGDDEEEDETEGGDDEEEEEDETEEDDEDDEEEEDETEEDEEEEDETEEDEDDEFEEEGDDEEEADDEIEANVKKAVAALEKSFGQHSSFANYVENYFLSDAVEEAFGDDMEPGVTKLTAANGNTYVLVGLDTSDDQVILINKKTGKLKKSDIASVARMEEV